MARDEAPPFERGATFYNGITPPDATSGGNLEGKIYVFEDLDLSVTGTKSYRSGRPVKCMVVRNVSGATLLPKRLASLKLSGLNFLGQVDGYATVDAAANCYPIDEWLPAAGVVANDLFYVVVDGPATVITGLANGAGNNIAVGGNVCALTAVTSQATTAGRIQAQDLSSSATTLGNYVQNKIGMAMTARTTNNTDSAILIDVRKW